MKIKPPHAVYLGIIVLISCNFYSCSSGFAPANGADEDTVIQEIHETAEVHIRALDYYKSYSRIKYHTGVWEAQRSQFIWLMLGIASLGLIVSALQGWVHADPVRVSVVILGIVISVLTIYKDYIFQPYSISELNSKINTANELRLELNRYLARLYNSDIPDSLKQIQFDNKYHNYFKSKVDEITFRYHEEDVDIEMPVPAGEPTAAARPGRKLEIGLVADAYAQAGSRVDSLDTDTVRASGTDLNAVQLRAYRKADSLLNELVDRIYASEVKRLLSTRQEISAEQVQQVRPAKQVNPYFNYPQESRLEYARVIDVSEEVKFDDPAVTFIYEFSYDTAMTRDYIRKQLYRYEKEAARLIEADPNR